jgi:hypothetical protein
MLLYEYQLRDQIDKLRQYAATVLSKFERNAPTSELLADTTNLKQVYDMLRDILPQEIKDAGNCGRHIGWMIHRLKEDSPKSCEGDIRDICSNDVRAPPQQHRVNCKECYNNPEMPSSF